MGLMERMERLGLTPRRILKVDDLEPGDHICTDWNKKSYYHHGNYIGDKRVIHFTKDSEKKARKGEGYMSRYSRGDRHNNTSYKRSSFVLSQVLLRKHSLYKFEYGLSLSVTSPINLGGSTEKCDDPKIVVARAHEKLENNDFGEYSLLWNNCETFAFLCKTGECYPFGSKQTL